MVLMQLLSRLLTILVILTMPLFLVLFFFNDTATTEIYTLSHTTLFRSRGSPPAPASRRFPRRRPAACRCRAAADRKSTRLNSSPGSISYAVFCLKKKNRSGSIPCIGELRPLQQKCRQDSIRE